MLNEELYRIGDEEFAPCNSSGFSKYWGEPEAYEKDIRKKADDALDYFYKSIAESYFALVEVYGIKEANEWLKVVEELEAENTNKGVA